MPDNEKKEVRIDTRMTVIESGIKEIKEQLGIITRKLNKAEAREKEQAERIIKIENICIELTELRKEMDDLRVQNRELKQRIQKIEDNSRRKEKIRIKKNIEIYGIPKKNGEDPKEIVERLAKTAKVEITHGDIEESYRVKAKDGGFKQIVVRFKAYEKKAELIKAMRIKRPRLLDIKEEPENRLIYVNEMITNETKQILYYAKQEGRNRNWYKIWIYAGDVYLQMNEKSKQIKLENLEQLEILIK